MLVTLQSCLRERNFLFAVTSSNEYMTSSVRRICFP